MMKDMQYELPGSGYETLEQEATAWMHSAGGRKIMRDLYALAAKYSKDWKRSGIPVAVSLLWEIERHNIKMVRARAQRAGVDLKKWGGFSLNNNFSAYLARHIMAHRKDWQGMFEVRELQQPRKPVQEIHIKKY
jgi:hypothetical protein